ncbi:MAG: hypothetical protein ABWY33_01125 [Cellulomonas sp.]
MTGRMRALLVAAVAVVLLFVGGTAAYAAWSRTVSLAPGTVGAGDFGITTAHTLNVAGMYPGEVRTGVLTVSRAPGTDGRWLYTLGAPTISAGTLAGQLTVRVYPTTACSGAVLTFPWTVATPQALTATPQHCISVTLAATAPTTVQGQTATITVPVTAENRSTY